MSGPRPRGSSTLSTCSRCFACERAKSAKPTADERALPVATRSAAVALWSAGQPDTFVRGWLWAPDTRVRSSLRGTRSGFALAGDCRSLSSMRPQDLVEGHCYFSLAYHSDERYPLQVPYIETLWFEAERTLEDGQRVWMFREAGEHDGTRFVEGDSVTPEESVVAYDERGLSMIVTLDELCQELTVLKGNKLFEQPARKRADSVDGLQGWPVCRSWLDRFWKEEAIQSVSVGVKFKGRHSVSFRDWGSDPICSAMFGRNADEGPQKLFHELLAATGHELREQRFVNWERDYEVTYALQDGEDLADLASRVLLEVFDVLEDDVLEAFIIHRDDGVLDQEGTPIPEVSDDSEDSDGTADSQ